MLTSKLNFKSLSLLGVLLTILCRPHLSFGQATVNEGLETAFLWVDTTVGSDTNPGTQAQPLKTIGAAVLIANNNKNSSIGTQISVNPGTYRESVVFSASPNTTNYPITLQAVTAGSVIVSGGVVYGGWTPYSGNASIYTAPWTNTWGLCPQLTSCTYQPNIIMRQEMIFVNGVPLTQVLAQTPMQPGTFYVDTVGALAYIWPAAGTNINTATVEVATLPNVLSIYNMSNIVIRGMVFQYANTCHATSAVQVDGSTNVLIDNDIFQWNNAQGLAINQPSSYFTVQNSSALYNGDSGFQEGQTNHGLWQNDVSSYNNWRGAQGAYYDCNVAGLHAWLAHNDTINNLTVSFNQTYGVHWDTDAYNVNVSGGMVANNVMSGLFLEKAEGPVSFANNYVCNQNSVHAVGGLQLRNSENVSLTGSVLSNNAPSQIYMTGQAGGLWVTNWETGQQYNLVTSYLTLSGNTILANNATQQVFEDGYLNGSDWTTLQTTLNSGSNTWWNPATTGAFTVPSPQAWTVDNLASWQSVTGQDFSSIFAAPSGNPAGACALTPAGSDFWFTADNGALTTDPSGHATFNLTMTPLNFTGTANLVLDGISEVPGLSATLSQTSINTSGTSALSITAASNTAAGTYPVTLLATSGNVTHTVSMLLTVPGTSIYISTINLNLGSAQVSTTGQSQSFTITNVGSSWVGLTSIVSNSSAFTQTNNCGSGLAAGKGCTVTVTFTPNVVGLISSTITVTDNDPTSPQTVNLTGTGLAAPTVSFSPNPAAFGNQEVGYTSGPLTVTLTNTGASTAAPLTISSVTLTGSKASDYSITANTCPSSPNPLNAGSSCSVTMTFTPSGSGIRNATLTVADNTGGDNQDTDSISGTGVLPVTTLSPSSLTFATQLVNTPSPTQTVTLTNSSISAILTISSVAITGSNKSDYTQTNNCPSTLAAAAFCTISVTFTPLGTGNRSASVTITDNTSAGSDTITLSGTGAWPTDSFTPATLTFTSQLVGTTSPGQATTLTNTSAVPLTITNITLGGAYPGDYAQTNNCPATLVAGATCSITVTFTPTGTGSHNATLKAYSNTTTSPDIATLNGTGALPTVTFTPSTLTYSSQLVGTTSPGQSVTLTNTGVVQLNITGVSFTGSNINDFAQTNTCGSSVPAGGTCSITVTFTPAATGTRTANLKVSDNSAAGSDIFTLSGTGALPTVTFSPTSLTFASQLVGTTSPGQTVTLTNTGVVQLNITNVTLGGAYPGDYTQTNTCGSTVAAGASCSITVSFTPPGTGTQAANLKVYSNTATSPDQMTLSGTGALPTVTFTPTGLTFTSQLVGTASPSQSVTLTNTGAVQLNISGFSFNGSSPNDFAQTNTCPATVAAGGTCTITMTFTPGATGTRSATLKVSDNSLGGSDNLNVSGTGAYPSVTFTPTSLTFSSQLVGTTSPSQSMTLTNTGAVPLTINSITLAGSKPGDFTQTNTCPATVAAGGTCTITVTFTPTGSGTRTASVNVSDNVSAGSSTANLTGTGSLPTVSFSPTSLTYTSQLIGTTSGSQTVTLTNTGVVQLNIASVTISGTAAADYSQTNTCGASVAANGTCTITVKFTPSTTGTRNATINVNDNSSSGDDQFSVSGTGSLPTVSFTPGSLTFSGQLPGTTSPPQIVTLTNTSSVLLSIYSVTITGTNPSDYAQTNTCGSTLAAGLTCNITVTFTPTTTGSRTATVTVSDSVSSGSSTLNLTGTGGNPTVSFSPSPLAFGTMQVGTSQTLSTILTNTSSSVPLTIASISLTGTYPGDYKQTNNCPSTVNAGATCTITVTFTPSANGSRNATLTVTDNVSAGSSTDSLTGTGAYPAASFSPSTLAFGNQEVGYKSSSISTTLTNTGSYTVTISSIALTGTYPGDYTQTNNCGATLAVNASCTFTVWVTPGKSGSRNATLTVNDNTSSGTTTASLTATGVYPTASLTPTTLAFGNQEVGYTSAGIKATLTNTSSWILAISSITFSGSHPSEYAQTNNCGASLAANASCTITVTFTPTATGSRSATLNVNDNVSGGKTTTSLTGTGIRPSATISPASDSFGNVTVGTTSSSKTSTLTNTSTNGAILNITSIAITGTNKGDYAQTNNCPSTLAVNATCSITVTFTPTATGTRTANVTITDNISAGSQTISLTGSGK